jgi:glucose-6-phosphate 1-dehydrogenase
MERPDNCILVIFGASGDLTKRKLIPALYALHLQGLLPEGFATIGVGRTEFTDEDFRSAMKNALMQYVDNAVEEHVLAFTAQLYYQAMDTMKTKSYSAVRQKINDVAQKLEIRKNVLFYFSTPPSMYETIARNLAAHGLNNQSESNAWKRIIVEKPFGRDLDSAIKLNASLQECFTEDQIYRIDHYLGKETVQNVLALRFANGIFEPLWNRNYVDRVEVTSAEHIGVEKRAGYYEQAGALRDMVQNHLLQILGTIAMEPPSTFSDVEVRNESVKVFQSLRQMKVDEVENFVVRGQYTDATVRGEKLLSYRDEENVAPESRTETFVALKLFIDNWRWGGVPFYLRTGKRLPTRVTEVVIHFKKTPHYMFQQSIASDVSCNQLVIRIQPDEGILLKYGMKVPGAGFDIQNVNMDFKYSSLNDSHIPAAYERLLLDCMLGDATLYARSDAVETCWNFVQPIIDAWKKDGDTKLYGYPSGTWGPKEATNLLGDPGLDWRHPCKNLSDDGQYCEL